MPRTRCRSGPRRARSCIIIRPAGLGVRIDSAVYHGYTIPPFYDSLVGKLIVHGKTRSECLMRLKRALDEFVVDGIETTLPLFRALAREARHHRRRLPHPLARGVPRARRARAVETSGEARIRVMGRARSAQRLVEPRVTAVARMRPTSAGTYGLGNEDRARHALFHPSIRTPGGIDHRQLRHAFPGRGARARRRPCRPAD